jgi:signal peptidase I
VPRSLRAMAQRRQRLRWWQESVLLAVVVLCAALLVRTFLFELFLIPSGSMEQTLQVGDRVLVNRLVYDFRDPRRGEIVVFGALADGYHRARRWPGMRA